MSLHSEFTIDPNQRFEQLPSAPIVEAVIHWQAPAGKTLDKDALRKELVSRFPDYQLHDQQEFDAKMQASVDGVELRQQTRWGGYRLTGKGAEPYVIQFKPNGIAFSRLKPYDQWETFLEAALPFWNAYLKFAEPPVIDRLGVRFINQIALTGTEGYSSYLRPLPTCPAGIDLANESFFYQDSYRVPGYPYHVNWVRTVPSTAFEDKALIVDIDVWTQRLASLEHEVLTNHLAEMRNIKDRLFFACMTDQAIERFRKARQ